VASITHFTQYILVLDLHHLTDDYIERTISRNIILEDGADNPKRAFWNNPYSEKEFVGNLTDTRLEVYARAAGTTVISSTRTLNATLAPAAHGITAGNVGGALATTSAGQTSPYFVTYSIKEWSLRALPPHNLPVKEIFEGDTLVAAYIAICSDKTSSSPPSNSSSTSVTSLTTTPSSSSRVLITTPASTLATTSAGSTKEFVLWDIKTLKCGQFIVIRQERMLEDRPPQTPFPSRNLTDVVTVPNNFNH
jgi:hypothetical protein